MTNAMRANAAGTSYWQLVLAVVAGAVLTLSLAPFDWWPIGLVSLGLWYYLLGQPCAGWRSGFAFGVGKFGVGVSWIYVSIHDYGNAPPVLAGFLVVLFVAFLAVWPMAQAAIYVRYRRAETSFNVLWFAALWLGLEWFWTWFLTGFPWVYAGYAHLETPLAGWAPVGGVLLIGFFVATTAAALVAIHQDRSRWWRYLLVAVAPWIIGAALFPVEWTQRGADGRVALAQGNVDQAVKWLPENRLPIIRKYVDLSEPYWGADLLIWPESAITVFESQAGELLDSLHARGVAGGSSLVLGVPSLGEDADGNVVFNNSALALGAGSGRYVKRRLVPFGEYVPFENLLRGLIGFFDLPMSHSVPGPWDQPLLHLGEHRASLAICYEVVYPNLVRSHGGEANVLLTITNDAWFGTSIGPLQHLQMVQMRSLENGRWMLRATNNGVTAIIDHRGRIVDRLPQFETGVLAGDFHYRTGRTPYVALGDAPVLICVAGLLALVWWMPKRRVKLPSTSVTR